MDFAIEPFQAIGSAQLALVAGWEGEDRQAFRLSACVVKVPKTGY
jgi:hypothetical protein